MHNTNAKLVRALTNNLNENRTSTTTTTNPTTINATATTEINRNNIIFVRRTKAIENGHIFLRTTTTTTTPNDNHHLVQSSKTNLVLNDNNGDSSNNCKFGQIFIQHQNDLSETVLLQSVKRLGAGTPIFLLSGNDNGNGHFLIQTASADDVHSVAEIGDEQGSSGDNNILLQALEGLHDNDAGSASRGISTPIGSGNNSFIFKIYLPIFLIIIL